MAIARAFNRDGGTLPDSSGSGAEVTENLTGQVNGQNTTFVTSQKFVAGKIRVYYNGVRQLIGDDVSEGVERTSISFTFAPLAGDKVVVDYEVSTS